jgi:uncharacterized membrane protein YgcG
VIYVPVYEPDVIYVDPGVPFISFGIGCAIGPWLNCDFDWGHRHIFIWNHNHPRPPNWWHERGRDHDNAFGGHNTTVWHPVNRPGAGRPIDRGYNNVTVHRPVPHPKPVEHSEPGSHPGPLGVPPGNTHFNNNHGNQQNNVHVGPVVGQPRPEQHFTPAPVPHNTPVIHSPAPSADTFIGIQSSRDTRSFSDRGQQSMGTAPHSAPAPAPAPQPVQHSAPSGGGGGREGGGGGGGGGSGGGGHRR